MDLFYRGFDPSDRIRSAGLHLSAAAARLAVSIVLSIPLLPEAVWSDFKRQLTLGVLWSLCLVLAGWVIATLVGGLVGLAVNGLLIAYGVIELWEDLKAVASSLKRWITTAYEARNPAELTEASKHFAEALSTGGLALIEIVITHRVFRAVEGRLRQSVPAPDWLKTQYEEALRTREQSNRGKDTNPRLREALKRTSEATEILRDAGAKRAAERFPVEAVVATGALLAMAAAGGVALAMSSADKRTRR